MHPQTSLTIVLHANRFQPFGLHFLSPVADVSVQGDVHVMDIAEYHMMLFLEMFHKSSSVGEGRNGRAVIEGTQDDDGGVVRR